MTRLTFLTVLFFCCCIHLTAQIPAFTWAAPIYHTSQSPLLEATPTDMAVDPAGNVYLTGEFRGKLDFGFFFIEAEGDNPALFLIKYSPNGNLLWARKAIPQGASAGSTIFNASSKIAVDANGNVYWCGDYQAAAIDFGEGTVVTGPCADNCREGFLLKINYQGTVLSQKSIHAAAGENLHLAGVAADSSGRHYLTGSYTGMELWLQGGANLGGLTTEGYFLAAYSVDGNGEWIAFQTLGSVIPASQAIAVSPDGNRIAVTGTYENTPLNFGNGAVTSSQMLHKSFAVWYNTVGQPTGAGTFASDQRVEVYDIQLDNQYRLWAACDFSSTMEWNGDTLATSLALGYGGTLVRVLPGEAGAEMSTIPYSSNSHPLNTFAIKPDNTFYTGGYASQTLYLPDTILGNSGCLDLVLTGGNEQALEWAATIGQMGCEQTRNLYSGSMMGIDGQGNVLVSGDFESNANLGPNAFNGKGLWIAKLATGTMVSVQDPAMPEMRIIPNPSDNFVRIVFPGNTAGRCLIHSVTGKIMAEMPVQADVIFDATQWPSGLYLAEYVEETGGRVVKKILVQH